MPQQPFNWLPNVQNNFGIADTNPTGDPQIIGLAGGNYLVVWRESGTTGVGTGAGFDIIGQIFTSQGVALTGMTVLNNFATNDEYDFDVAATNNGGFVLVYVDDSIANVNQTSIIWQFHNGGTMLQYNVVATENVAADSLSNPTVTVNMANNDSMVSYTDNVGGNANINGVTVSIVGVVSAEFALAQNSADADTSASIAVLAGGNIVSVYSEVDTGVNGIEIKIVSPTGAPVAGPFTLTANAASDAQVAALTNGNAVVTWTEGSDIFYRIYNSTGGSVVAATAIGAVASVLNETSVVGLPQGGFVVVYDDDTNNRISGQLFDNAGNLVGGEVILFSGSADQPTVSATADGRILLAFASSSNVFHSIWDPRDATIDAATFDITNLAFMNNFGPVSGNAGANTMLSTVVGSETFFGGDGDDTFVTQAGATLDNDTYNGGNGIDTLDFSAGAAFSSNVRVRLDLNDIVNVATGERVFMSSIENYIGNGSERITGNSANNSLTGGAGNNAIFGGSGNDLISGGDGNDVLTGEAGFDTIVGGAGDDTIVFTAFADYDNVSGGDGIDTIDASLGTMAISFDMNTVNLVANSFVYSVIGIERLIGTQLNDVIFNRTNASTSSFVDGGAGDDIIHAAFGFDNLDGGAGIDTLNTTSFNGDYIVNLTTGLSNFGGETFLNFENIVSGAGNDTLTGTSTANEMEGGDGNDVLIGLDGNDNLVGGNGNDSMDGGIGGDVMQGGAGDDIYVLDTGADLIFEFFGQGTDTVQSSIDYTLGLELENLILLDGATEGIGNEANNVVTGNLANNVLFGEEGDDTLNGEDGNDVLTGGDGIDTINGGDGNDIIDGGNGADVAFGGAGDDMFLAETDNGSIDGGTGSDTVDYSVLGAGYAGTDFYWDLATGYRGNVSFSDPVIISFASIENFIGLEGNDIVRGTADANSLSGREGEDVLTGEGGDDVLLGGLGNDSHDGGTGNDYMEGNGGDDSYVVDSAGDTVLELNGEGTDTVTSSISLILNANVENLILTGAALDGTGNAENNVISGTTAANALIGNDGSDTLNGDGGADTLTGGAGDDMLNGGAGVDTMTGGAGNDIYIVDSAAETITELADEGIDTIRSSVNLSLAANFEVLELTGTATNGSGNALGNFILGNNRANLLTGFAGDDTLVGGAGVDTLNGGDGDDTLEGGTSADTMIGGAGNDSYTVNLSTDVVTETANNGTDIVFSTSTSFTLSAHVENGNLLGAAAGSMTGNTLANVITGNLGANTLAGLGGNDTLVGGDGNDKLIGGAGTDSLTGGIGNDTYQVVDLLDTITELVDEGIDLVQSSVDFTLGANLEKLFLSGAALVGIGNELANTIIGTGGANTLNGMAGNDFIYGGNGNDVISGGAGRDQVFGEAGADVFAFADGDFGGVSSGTADIIRDFSIAQGDSIDLSAVDAIVGGADSAFTLIGNAAFNGTAGQLRVQTSATSTIVMGDTNGDGIADFWIVMNGVHALTVADFVL